MKGQYTREEIIDGLVEKVIEAVIIDDEETNALDRAIEKIMKAENIPPSLKTDVFLKSVAVLNKIANDCAG